MNEIKSCNIDTVSKTNNNLSHIIIKGKDRTFGKNKNNVVYKVNCDSCSYSYVGQSKRSFDIRKGERQKKKVLLYIKILEKFLIT